MTSESLHTLDLEALLVGHWLTDFANFSAFVMEQMPDLNWAGFYFWNQDRLRLGPFCGRPACTEIAPSRGVCGAAFREKRALIVADVHEFPGHIACDPRSRSELVVPLVHEGQCWGVFDIDSPTRGRFTDKDQKQVEAWLSALTTRLPADVMARAPWR